MTRNQTIAALVTGAAACLALSACDAPLPTSAEAGTVPAATSAIK